MKEEYHEHPFFNSQGHYAVWVKTWASSSTNDEAPEDAPVTCAVCGRLRGANPSYSIRYYQR